ncbi:hypothetical protein V7S43_008041 [Phytophthora oleae]|uniref:Uncharacterized protein n=1 Tax=Phytophthora oleae TaxID=2107226 RepID=A0ABD3FQ17_9STRA
MSTEEQTSRASFDSDDSTASTWQDRVRRGLASDEMRLRLHTYSTLSTKCSESKEMQKQVGQLFGGPRDGIMSRFATSSLLNVLFDDLRSTDRTLRVAAARVLCLMAYENLRNQQLIIQSQVNGDEEQIGATVGWMHVFSIPPSLRDRYEAQCEERGLFTTPRGLMEFVSDVIKDNYASIYSRIGRYYAGGCREFLPLCWFHALVNDSSEPTDLMDIPDPNENLLGVYLIPRQMQFPEQDDYFLQEILSSIRTEAELSRLQQVHTAFEKVAFRAKEGNAAALKRSLEGVYNRSCEGEEGHSNVLHWLNASPERMVTWNELLIWCCTDMNAEEMLKRFGADVCRAVDAAFRRLTLGNEKVQLQMHQATSYVWESTLVGALLEHRDLPEELKTNIRVLASGYVNQLDLSRRKIEGNNPNNTSITSTNNSFERPWEYLLPLELTEIHPVSWSMFLSKWRQSVDLKPDEETHIYHQSERRHHSVGEHSHPSVLIARKNALVSIANNPRIFHSFRDLNQLRQQLPLIANRPSEVTKEVVESVPMSNRLRSITESQFTAEEQRDLDEKRKLFRKLQRSSIELDEVTRQQLEQKREERYKAHKKAAENREKKQQLAAQRQHEFERRKHDRQLKVQERTRRKEHRWQSRIAARQERHERAQWWKQVQQDAEVERQEEFMQQLKEQRESAQNLLRSESVVAAVSLPQPPPRAPCPRRPLSARAAIDPHIIRARAHVYGCAATDAFAARRPHSARPDLSDTHSRRRVCPPDNKGDGQTEATNIESNNCDPPAPGLVNACETLVMTNAAHAVAQEIAIPTVTSPVPEDQSVAPAVIMAQYLALEKDQRFKLHERYCGNRVSHKLTFAVLQQLTHEMRQDAAWREFLKAAGGSPGVNASKRNKSKREAKVTYSAFAAVAAQLGITAPPKKLQAVARSLDPWKTGFVAWEAFYTWWSSQ